MRTPGTNILKVAEIRPAIAVFTTFIPCRLFAIAPRGGDPSILLYQLGSKQPKARLVLPAPLAESCVTAIAINRDGSRVLAVSTLPSCALAVWDTRTGELLPGVAGAALAPGVAYTDASFCPVCISSILV